MIPPGINTIVMEEGLGPPFFMQIQQEFLLITYRID